MEQTQDTTMAKGGATITPRCLTALPLDIEEILKQFENQEL